MLTSSTSFRTTLTRAALFRLVLGWGSFLTLLVLSPVLSVPLPGWALWSLLGAMVAVITVSAFGVVTEAERLAHRLGDPYGTLVLTLSIAAIEVILISAVMLGPGEHATIGRDSVMGVSMIILNLVIGVALMTGSLRHPGRHVNRTGMTLYLGMLVVLLSVAFAFPALIGANGAYTPAQSILLVVLTLGLYTFFLVRQLGKQREDFQEVADAVPSASEPDAAPPPMKQLLRGHSGELTARTLLLIAMVLPIVLVSHDMAPLLDEGLSHLGAPAVMSGILIAVIVFLPETITTLRAALVGEMQRVSNLCHGALVSTAGLTIPAVLATGLITGQRVQLAESPTNLVLIGVTLLLTLTTFSSRRLTALHGAAHLFLFALYGLSVFG